MYQGKRQADNRKSRSAWLTMLEILSQQESRTSRHFHALRSLRMLADAARARDWVRNFRGNTARHVHLQLADRLAEAFDLRKVQVATRRASDILDDKL